MKPGAKFHDGSPITADDVVFSMERILAMKQGAYGLYKGVIDPGKTKALDPHTVQFTLNKPYAVFSATLSELWVVNSKLLREHDKSGDMGAAWLARNEAGSGGFKLRRYDPAIGFQADRFDAAFRRLRQIQHHLDGIPRGAGNREPRAWLAEGRVQHHRRLSAAGPDQAAAQRRQRADPGSGIAAHDVLHHPQCSGRH